ncbi:hypothetical protein AB4238_20125 [Shewanella sp. 10N.286.45.A1]|uniref:hypothetical protein n=1 Tax=Shewanella sp. 10N.286.45.A1 TaxID=3229694 RepID=UPI00354D68CE
MKNNLLVCALLACGLAFQSSTIAAPTEIDITETDNKVFTTEIETDENDITHVTVNSNGKQHQLAFTAQELKDKEVIKQKLTVLPKEDQAFLTRTLSRMQQPSKDNVFIIDTKQDKTIKIKLEKLYQELDGKTTEIEAHVVRIEAKSGELEAKALELEQLFEQNEGDFEIHIDSLSDEIELITEQITALEVMRFGDSNNHGQFIIINDDDEQNAEHILSLINHSELTKEDREKLIAALKDAK